MASDESAHPCPDGWSCLRQFLMARGSVLDDLPHDSAEDRWVQSMRLLITVGVTFENAQRLDDLARRLGLLPHEVLARIGNGIGERGLMP